MPSMRVCLYREECCDKAVNRDGAGRNVEEGKNAIHGELLESILQTHRYEESFQSNILVALESVICQGGEGI